MSALPPRFPARGNKDKQLIVNRERLEAIYAQARETIDADGSSAITY